MLTSKPQFTNPEHALASLEITRWYSARLFPFIKFRISLSNFQYQSVFREGEIFSKHSSRGRGYFLNG